MSTKQKIILRRYRDGDSESKISRELKINRETVQRYIAEHEKPRLKLSEADKKEEVLPPIGKKRYHPDLRLIAHQFNQLSESFLYIILSNLSSNEFYYSRKVLLDQV